MKLENDHNVFVSTRNPDKFSGSNITAQKLDLDEDYNADWLPDSLDGFIYLPGTINLRPFKGLKPSTFIDDFDFLSSLFKTLINRLFNFLNLDIIS